MRYNNNTDFLRFSIIIEERALSSADIWSLNKYDNAVWFFKMQLKGLAEQSKWYNIIDI